MAVNKVVFGAVSIMDISDSTVSPDTLAKGVTAYAANGEKITGTMEEASDPNLQSKTVTPTTSKQEVTADSGYDGLEKVTVNAMPTATQATPTISVDSAGKITVSATQAAGYVSAGTKSATKQLTTQGAQSITPGTSDTTIASGRYLTGAQTIKGDANLVPENIVSGKSIFGVAGTAESGGSGGGDQYLELAQQLIDKSVEEIDYAFTENIILLNDYAFAGYVSLRKLKFGDVPETGNFVFAGCEILNIIDFSSLGHALGGCFDGISAEYTAVILRNSITTMSSMVFERSGGISFFVPSALLSDYQSNYPDYSDKFIALEEYTLDGTTTGELDEDKIHSLLGATEELEVVILDATGESEPFVLYLEGEWLWGEIVFGEYNSDGRFTMNEDDGNVYFDGSALYTDGEEGNIYQVNVNMLVEGKGYYYNMPADEV